MNEYTLTKQIIEYNNLITYLTELTFRDMEKKNQTIIQQCCKLIKYYEIRNMHDIEIVELSIRLIRQFSSLIIGFNKLNYTIITYVALKYSLQVNDKGIHDESEFFKKILNIPKFAPSISKNVIPISSKNFHNTEIQSEIQKFEIFIKYSNRDYIMPTTIADESISIFYRIITVLHLSKVEADQFSISYQGILFTVLKEVLFNESTYIECPTEVSISITQILFKKYNLIFTDDIYAQLFKKVNFYNIRKLACIYDELFQQIEELSDFSTNLDLHFDENTIESITSTPICEYAYDISSDDDENYLINHYNSSDTTESYSEYSDI